MVKTCTKCGRIVIFTDDEKYNGFKPALDELHEKGEIEFNVRETHIEKYNSKEKLNKQHYINADYFSSKLSDEFCKKHYINDFYFYYNILTVSHKCGPKEIVSDEPIAGDLYHDGVLTYECDFHDVITKKKEIETYEKKYGQILLAKQSEIDSFICPICGCAHFKDVYKKTFLNTHYTYEKLLEITDKQFKENSENSVRDLLHRYSDNDYIINTSQDELSSTEICSFLQHLSKLESSIMLLTRHLYNLEHKLLYAQIDDWSNKYESLKTLEKEFEQKLNDNETLQVAIQKEYTITNDTPTKYGITKPILPTTVPAFEMQKPNEPIPIKPGLFNKNKVIAQNEANTNNYLAKVKEYEMAKKEHEEKTQAYQIEMESYRRENDIYQKACQQLYQKLNAELKEKEKQLDVERECIISQRKEALSVCETNREPHPYYVFMSEEVEKTKALLIKLLEARSTMHASGIIHPKYFEVAAIATMCEYFEVGRVDSLTGSTGAYNLYESELRSNLIISKLDAIIESLEQIKKNQFKLYTILEGIESDLQGLNCKLDKVNDFLGDMSMKMTSIEKNTAATAYYAEQTAKYTKINAELTNALGFMVALK